MSADELSVRLTARDELSGKLKSVQAEVKKSVDDLTHLNKNLDTPHGKKAYDDARASLAQLSREQSRLRTEVGKNERAIKSFGTTSERQADKTVAAQKRVKNAFLGSRKGAALFGAGAAVAMTKVLGAAKGVATGFDAVGKSTGKLQRIMGGSAEDASRLTHALAMSGITTDKAAPAIARYSKNIASMADAQSSIAQMQDASRVATTRYDAAVKTGNKDRIKSAMQEVTAVQRTLAGLEKTADKNPLGKLGVSAVDAAGKAKSTNTILMDTIKHLGKMEPGAAKTALSMRLFGREGSNMLPFLSKSKKEIKDLYSESDRLGTTLSGKDLAAVKDSTKAKRLWGESVRGVQIALGRELYPVLTKGANFLSQRVAPNLKMVVAYVKQNKDWIGKLAVGLGILFGVLKVATAVQAAFNVVMALNPVGLVVIGIAALIAVVVVAYKKVDWFRTAIGYLIGGFKTYLAVTKVVWSTVWSIIKGAVGKIVGAVKRVGSALSGIWTGVSGAAKGAFNGIARAWNNTIGKLHWTLPKILGFGGGTISAPQLPMLAKGGPVTAGLRAVVGEVGPELFVPNIGAPRIIGRDGPDVESFATSGFVIPNHLMPTAPAMRRERELVGAGAGGPLVAWNIGTFNADSGVDVENRVLHAVLRADRIKAERR